jgi:hypothetical protein
MWKKSWWKSRLCSVRVVIENLIFLKDSFSTGVHLKPTYFLIIFYKNLDGFSKSGTNIMRKFSLMKNDFITLLLINTIIYVMDLVLSE